MASQAKRRAEINDGVLNLIGTAIIFVGVYLVMGGWNQFGDNPIVVSNVSSFASKGVPLLGDHLTSIQGSMTNNFAHGDAWCSGSSFKLIGQGQTVEAASGRCDSSMVARDTSTKFAFFFPVQDPGEYELRFDRQGGGILDAFMRKSMTQTIVIK